jgi:hypothetical protein
VAAVPAVPLAGPIPRGIASRAAFTDGIAPKPETTFGNVKADVLERCVPGYQRANLVDIIKNSDWPE